MNRSCRAFRFWASAIITALMFTSIVTLFFTNDTAMADAANTYSQLELKTLNGTNGNTTYYLLEPEEEGTYPVVVLFPGLGGMSRYEENLVDYANNWVSSGLVDKYVFVLPYFQGGDDGRITDSQLYSYVKVNSSTNKSHMQDLVDQILNGNISDKIDTNADISVAGYSMGACASLYAVMKDTDRIVNVGALSPSFMLYRATDDWGWVLHGNEDEFVFSDDPNAHIYLSSSRVEQSGGRYQDMLRYEDVIRGQGYDPTVETFDTGDHVIEFFMKEIFSFLYLIENDTLPSEDLIARAEAGTPPTTTTTTTEATTTTTEATTTTTTEEPTTTTVATTTTTAEATTTTTAVTTSDTTVASSEETTTATVAPSVDNVVETTVTEPTATSSTEADPEITTIPSDSSTFPSDTTAAVAGVANRTDFEEEPQPDPSAYTMPTDTTSDTSSSTDAQVLGLQRTQETTTASTSQESTTTTTAAPSSAPSGAASTGESRLSVPKLIASVLLFLALGVFIIKVRTDRIY
ncbi:MAG: esterase family protein [Saccharofermentans sp.]|nr:esterase family protein [Saccharofermentans sp.]